jgi:hypothetical protein
LVVFSERGNFILMKTSIATKEVAKVTGGE